VERDTLCIERYTFHKSGNKRNTVSIKRDGTRRI